MSEFADPEQQRQQLTCVISIGQRASGTWFLACVVEKGSDGQPSRTWQPDLRNKGALPFAAALALLTEKDPDRTGSRIWLDSPGEKAFLMEVAKQKQQSRKSSWCNNANCPLGVFFPCIADVRSQLRTVIRWKHEELQGAKASLVPKLEFDIRNAQGDVLSVSEFVSGYSASLAISNEPNAINTTPSKDSVDKALPTSIPPSQVANDAKPSNSSNPTPTTTAVVDLPDEVLTLDPGNVQWAAYRRLDLAGGRFRSVSVRVVTKSPYFRFGFKMRNTGSPLFGDGGIASSHGKNMVVHIGRNKAKSNVFFTSYRNGVREAPDAPLHRLHSSSSILMTVIVDDASVLTVKVGGNTVYWQPVVPEALDEIVMLAWADENEFRLEAKNIQVEVVHNAHPNKTAPMAQTGNTPSPSKPNLATFPTKVAVNLNWADRREVDDSWLRRLQTQPDASLIQWLSVDGTSVTDVGIENLNALRSLSFLAVCRTPVGNAGIAKLNPRLLPLLTDLHLAKTLITDQGVEHLVGHKSLLRLALSHTKVGDDGMDVVSRIRTLRRLWLDHLKTNDDSRDGCPSLTDKGIKLLAAR